MEQSSTTRSIISVFDDLEWFEHSSTTRSIISVFDDLEWFEENCSIEYVLCDQLYVLNQTSVGTFNPIEISELFINASYNQTLLKKCRGFNSIFIFSMCNKASAGVG